MLHNSYYTMCTRGSPDIYTLSPRACGPRALGVYIRQTTRAHGITIKYIYIYIRIYVTVFYKTNRIDTNTEIHFLPVDESHTHALFRDTKHLRLDGRVYFYR